MGSFACKTGTTNTPLPTTTSPTDTTLVTFPDANLEAAVRGMINKPEGPIYNSDLGFLTALYAVGRDISNLTGLEYCTNLTRLDLTHNNISDVSPLAGLTNLGRLYLEGNNISDISPLAGLTNLRELWLGRNNIGDLSPLAGLTNLELLDLEGREHR